MAIFNGSCTRATSARSLVFANDTATETTTKSEANKIDEIFLNMFVPLSPRIFVRFAIRLCVWVVLEMNCIGRTLPQTCQKPDREGGRVTQLLTMKEPGDVSCPPLRSGF